MGIVRKKRITNKKSKTNLSNEKSNSINNSKSNSLQNGGNKLPKPGSAPSVPKAGKIDFNVKRNASQTMSRPKQALLATGKVAKGIVQGAATLAVAPVAAVAASFRALGTGAYAAGLYGKAAAQSAASVPKLAYQAEKLRQAKRTMNRVTGADVYKSHQDKHAKLIANYQAQTKKYGSLADGGKKLSSLANAFEKNKAKLNTSLEKRVTGTSKWSRFYKPFTPKSNYKMSTNNFAAKIKATQSGDPLKPLDFSQIIKDKQAAYNASQTAKKTAEIEKRTGKKQAALNAVAKTHSSTQSVLSKAQESRNALQTKLTDLNSKNPLTMTKEDRAKHFAERNTILKTKQVANKTFKSAELAHTKSESLLEKAQTALNARKASANKTARKKFSTTENIQSSINRRTARLNTTKKKIGSYFSDATEKVGRDWERTKRVFTRPTNFTLGRSAKGKAEYNAKVQAYTVKRDARKAAAEVAKAQAGPGFFAKLRTAITPNMLRGAKKLTKPVEHIGKLDLLKGQINNFDKKLEEINPKGINYDLERQRLMSEGKTDADPEMQKLNVDQKNYNKVKIEKTKIQMSLQQRENTLSTVSRELHKRISPGGIAASEKAFSRMSPAKKASLPGLFDESGNLLPRNKLNLDTIKTLMADANSKDKMYTYNLLQKLYKDKKNLDATDKIDGELASIKESSDI